MSDTDTTHIAPRPTAIRDLRYAGTIATGLVAGTLGLGALAAPLVGWKDWTSGLERNASAPTLTMASPKTQEPAGSKANVSTGTGETGPGSAAPLRVGLPGGGTPTGLAVLVSNDGQSTTSAQSDSGERASGARADGPRSTVVSSPENGTSTTSTGEAKFTSPDMDDNDGDGIPNDVERSKNLNPDVKGDAKATKTENGISVDTAFRIANGALAKDTNGDGRIDGDDDSDGDGVSNAVEEANGSDPLNPDTNLDGIPDGMEDWNGDGYPDGLPVPATPPADQTPVDDEPTPVTPPAEETPVEEETPAPPVDTPPVAEAPAPTDPTPGAPPAEAPETTPPAPEATPAPATPAPPAPEAAPVVEAPPAAPAPVATPAPVETQAPAAVETPAPAQPEQAAVATPAADPAATPAW